jgi:Domain of unknown function (DUF4349)
MNQSYLISIAKILIISILLISCSSKSFEQASDNEISEVSAATADTVMAILSNPNLVKGEMMKNKKFIRTADSKFSVKDVKRTTQKIQDLTGKYGGYVTNMSLRSETTNTKTVPISADSLAEITTFSVHNDLTIRVPNQQLDSLLRDVFQLVEYWDSCEIKADEVTLSLLSTSLKIKRLDSFSERNKNNIDKKKGTISDASLAEEAILQNQNQADDYLIEQQSIEDQINFSTINLHIYQAPDSRKTIITNPESIEAYRPNLFIRLFDSVKDGWIVLEELLVFLFKFWVLFVVGVLGYILVKKYRK